MVQDIWDVMGRFGTFWDILEGFVKFLTFWDNFGGFVIFFCTFGGVLGYFFGCFGTFWDILGLMEWLKKHLLYPHFVDKGGGVVGGCG